MQLSAYTQRRLIASAKLGLAAVPFVVLIRITQGGFIPGAIILGFGLGFTVGIAELFLLRQWFRQLPFFLHLLVKSSAILCFLCIGFALLNILDVLIVGITWQAYLHTVFSWQTVQGLLVMLCIIIFLLFFVQLDRLLGPGVLFGYLTGKYHQPRREQRIFMFLDLKDSTAIADEMRGDRYFTFLHHYFSEMSEPILRADARIYQYVGDEVVLTWLHKRGVEDANCLRVFFEIRDHLYAQRAQFVRAFGRAPEFKAGVHGGEVITAQIGDLKKEIVYNGDVLNTAARIQAQCNVLGHALLVSEELMDELNPGSNYSITRLGPIALKGKTQPVRLCAVEQG